MPSGLALARRQKIAAAAPAVTARSPTSPRCLFHGRSRSLSVVSSAVSRRRAIDRFLAAIAVDWGASESLKQA